jgi:hypothetical protein
MREASAEPEDEEQDDYQHDDHRPGVELFHAEGSHKVTKVTVSSAVVMTLKGGSRRHELNS